MKTVYSNILITIIVFFCVIPTQAFPPNIDWHAGQVTLWNKTILEGNVSYNWLAEMVMICQTDGRVATFSAEQVSQFGWFDYNQHKYRDFKSLPNTLMNSRMNYAFFEVCMDGSLTVVRRIKRSRGIWKRAFGHPMNFTDKPEMAQTVEHFDYYVQDADRLLALDRFYTEIYAPILNAYDRELTHYMVSHNLNSQTLLGRLVLIGQYNLLVQQDAKTASARSYDNAPN